MLREDLTILEANAERHEFIRKLIELINHLAGRNDSREMMHFMRSMIGAGEPIIETSLGVFLTGDYLIACNIHKRNSVIASGYKIANSLKLSCAPLLVDLAKISDDFSALITFLPGRMARRLLSGHAVSTTSREVREHFLDSIKVLLKAGYVHPRICYWDSYIFTHPDTGEIYIEDWAPIRKIEPEESSEEFENQAIELLGLE